MIDASQTVVPRWLVLGACASLQVEPKSGSSIEVEVWVLKRSKRGLFGGGGIAAGEVEANRLKRKPTARERETEKKNVLMAIAHSAKAF
jgi:hypothetical protein